MTVPEIAALMRSALGHCVYADEGVSPTGRNYFTAVQNAALDEEVIAFWLSVSCLKEHHVPMFVAKQWAGKATNISEWMALLERNTAPRRNN
jgi:hypothetical protein